MVVYQHEQRKDLAAAAQVLHEAIGRKKGVPEFYEYLVHLHEQQKRYDQAIATLQRAIRAMPDEGRWYFALAALYERVKDRERAIAAMREVLKRDPRDATALNYIGYTYAEQGRNLDEAEALLQAAATLRPNDGYIIDSLAWLYFQKGDHTRALDLLRRASQLSPKEGTIWYHLAAVYAKLGDARRALALARQARALFLGKDETNVDDMAKLEQLIKELGARP
ncbi:MAG: tetratricopeptide repeat protein [Deltaproteobacteria bacterium]|nr:tetratricopeptide repeat protein [Deltaproteobacteria bacterium]